MQVPENRPEIRCSHLKSKFKALELLDPAARERVLGRFPKDIYKIIQETKDDQWVPVDYMVELCNCFLVELGEQKLYDWNLKAFNYSIESSIWGKFLKTALNLFRIKTTAFMKLGPSIWKSMYRNCGELSFISNARNQHQILIRNLPPVLLESRPYLMAIGSAFVGLFALGNIKAQVTLEQLKNTKDALYLISLDLTLEDHV
jgi:hypothetical protein